ncbi:MAG TPA: hypothetical protein DCQ99_03520 [Nitrospinae bacterium]|nr:MAG: hypothetical protein A3C43_07710 [Candidatus Schekmanbacteria bacterium RIFCSPHIGHO2_02_FULL_38_11]HAP66883.1 hypothetical protein [Nitrospinota bacterium]HBA27324.1 hypothetical protein [Nitrospinota bacterium]
MNHHANIKSSDRLQKVLEVLSDCRPHTTLEIAELLSSIPNRKSKLCQYTGKTDSNRKIRVKTKIFRGG